MKKYRGYEIRPVEYQGTTCYKVPALEGPIAVNVATARKWIDQGIAQGELRRIPEEENKDNGRS